MGVGAGLYMCDVVKKFTFAISSPDEFLSFFVLSIQQNTVVTPILVLWSSPRSQSLKLKLLTWVSNDSTEELTEVH